MVLCKEQYTQRGVSIHREVGDTEGCRLWSQIHLDPNPMASLPFTSCVFLAKNFSLGTSLVAQWLRICLLM